MDYLENSKECSGLPQDRLIGIQQIIVPYRIIKYRLRDGSGSSVSPGMSIYCYMNVFLIDGTQIITSKGNKITKFLFGRKRLIQGLQLGLKKVKKDEKLRLIISPQYAYNDRQDISLIPPNSKLIFQIEVTSMSFTPIQKMTDTQLYYEVYHYLDESDSFLRCGKEDEGLFALTNAYIFAKKIKHYKCKIVGKILMKWSNILYYRGAYENSLLILNRIDKSNETIQDCVRMYIKIYQGLEKKEELQKFLQKMWAEYGNDHNLKRVIVNYYKEIKNWEKLHKLSGYDFKKDRFFTPKPTQSDPFWTQGHLRLFG